ncbi:Unknown protein [Striga hermonthica]|uniref:GRF-type domain-containing protein n=1 Tax=Striga hermonthica TaxID=68872 RepID=A0A9N7MGY8_STRHE|nr:Unknown protein [Striga hermonthica]
MLVFSNVRLLSAFGFPQILTEYLRYWRVGFSQVSPIAWLKIISLLVLFSQQGWEMTTPDDIRALFLMKETRKKSGQFSIFVRDPSPKIDLTRTLASETKNPNPHFPQIDLTKKSENSYVSDHRFCYCDQRAVIQTSWTTENPGRRFRSCIGSERGRCDFFSWVDPPICKRAKEIIPGLLRKSNVLRVENEELREENMRLVELKKKLELENSVLQMKMQSNKKTKIWLVLGVVLFFYLFSKTKC